MGRAYSAAYSPRIQRQFKKIKDPELVESIKDAREKVLKDPFSGDTKRGDLQGVLTASFRCRGTSYRIAYYVERSALQVLFLFYSSRESFYEELKRYLDGSGFR